MLRVPCSMLYVYTGDGKGKTSAAIGTIIRAHGAGKSCAIVFFDKNPEYCNEFKVLQRLGIGAHIFGQNRIQNSPPLEKDCSSSPPLEKDCSSSPPLEKDCSSSPPLEKGGEGGFNNKSFFRLTNDENDKQETQKALEKAKELTSSSDVLVLDEYLNVVRTGQIELSEAINFLDNFPKDRFLILTGRGLLPEIAERADLISEIKKIKHPFDKGIPAQKGIDF